MDKIKTAYPCHARSDNQSFLDLIHYQWSNIEHITALPNGSRWMDVIG